MLPPSDPIPDEIPEKYRDRIQSFEDWFKVDGTYVVRLKPGWVVSVKSHHATLTRITIPGLINALKKTFKCDCIQCCLKRLEQK